MKTIELIRAKSYSTKTQTYVAGQKYIVQDDVAVRLLRERDASDVPYFRLVVLEKVVAPPEPVVGEVTPTITHKGKTPVTVDLSKPVSAPKTEPGEVEKTLTTSMNAKAAIALIEGADTLDNLSVEGDERKTVLSAWAARAGTSVVDPPTAPPEEAKDGLEQGGGSEDGQGEDGVEI